MASYGAKENLYKNKWRGGIVMNEIIKNAISEVIVGAAKATYESTSCIVLYEPEVPEKLLKSDK